MACGRPAAGRQKRTLKLARALREKGGFTEQAAEATGEAIQGTVTIGGEIDIKSSIELCFDV